MMKPLTRIQKFFAYASLLLVIISTLFGMFIIWLYLTEIYGTG